MFLFFLKWPISVSSPIIYILMNCAVEGQTATTAALYSRLWMAVNKSLSSTLGEILKVKIRNQVQGVTFLPKMSPGLRIFLYEASVTWDHQGHIITTANVAGKFCIGLRRTLVTVVFMRNYKEGKHSCYLWQKFPILNKNFRRTRSHSQLSSSQMDPGPCLLSALKSIKGLFTLHSHAITC